MTDQIHRYINLAIGVEFSSMRVDENFKFPPYSLRHAVLETEPLQILALAREVFFAEGSESMRRSSGLVSRPAR